MRSVEDTAVAFDRACRASGVAYAFVGGIAVAAWGQPRATTDVVALAALTGPAVETLHDALTAEGLSLDPRDLLDALKDGGHVTIFDERSQFHVDLALAKTRAELDELSRAVDLPFASGRIRVVRPEDTVAFKVLFGTPQDLQDARSILVRQGRSLDEGLLRRAAERLGVWPAVEAMLQDTPRD